MQHQLRILAVAVEVQHNVQPQHLQELVAGGKGGQNGPASAGQNGTTNTGGGAGGGAASGGGAHCAGNGGSGIVIIRYKFQ